MSAGQQAKQRSFPGGPQWADSLLSAIAARLGSVPAPRPLSLEDADKAADAMVNTLAGVIAQSTPEQDLGPFYSTTGLTKRLGVTRQALDGRIARHTLLALPGDDGSRLYPAFQFIDAAGRLDVLPGLPKVMKALAAVDDEPIGIAAWVTAQTGGLDRGSTAIEHLRNGGDTGQVLDLIDADAERLAH
jgi:hypothetical protein